MNSIVTIASAAFVDVERSEIEIVSEGYRSFTTYGYAGLYIYSESSNAEDRGVQQLRG
jgi:hypothetical protein